MLIGDRQSKGYPMKGTFGFTLVFALVCSTASAIASAAQPSAAALAKQLDDKGAKATVSGMSESDWGKVWARIASGNTEWVALAPRLAEGTDAGSSEDLGIGLAYALPKNPTAVLKAIDPNNGPVLGVSRVCSAPFIEDTVKDIPRYIRRAKAALNKVHAPALQIVKNACLAELAKP